MNERWSRVEAVLHEALSRAPADRAAFVETACAGDLELRHEVTSLPAQEADARSFLEQPALGIVEPLAVGRQLGGYRIENHLGTGGMGEVYRGRDTVLERDVAVNVLSPALAADAEAAARLGLEARVLAALSHPHIATIYGLQESSAVVIIQDRSFSGLVFTSNADETARSRRQARSRQ